MADMDWVRKIEQNLLTFPDEWSCPCSYCVSTRRLIAAVRLAEEALSHEYGATGSYAAANAMDRLRSGEVEEK